MPLIFIPEKYLPQDAARLIGRFFINCFTALHLRPIQPPRRRRFRDTSTRRRQPLFLLIVLCIVMNACHIESRPVDYYNVSKKIPTSCASFHSEIDFSDFWKQFNNLDNVITLRSDVEVYELGAAQLWDYNVSWSPIMNLWLLGEGDSVELLWWNKDDRETRIFIVALFWCFIPPFEGTSNETDFESRIAHFEPRERALRSQEVEFVKANLAIFAKKFSKIYGKLNNERSQELSIRYAKNAEKFEKKTVNEPTTEQKNYFEN